jgi:protein-S-isoprenylcysteine O-methyltransferase Ste14
MKTGNVLPPTYFYAAVVIMIALHFFLPIGAVIPSPWNWLGIIPLVCGVVLNLVADQSVKKAQTTVKPFKESSALITSGVFRICRNPMYLGFVFILVGIAVFLRSLSPFFLIPIFAYWMDCIFIRVEERMLAEKFGLGWTEYEHKVRRWI